MLEEKKSIRLSTRVGMHRREGWNDEIKKESIHFGEKEGSFLVEKEGKKRSQYMFFLFLFVSFF